MIPSFTDNPQVVDTIVHTFSDPVTLYEFLRVHKRAYQVLSDENDATLVRGFLLPSEVEAYKVFEWPKDVAVDIEIAVQYCELVPAMGIGTIADWVIEAVDELNVHIGHNKVIQAPCGVCGDTVTRDEDIQDIREVIDLVKDDEVYCWKNLWCMLYPK